MVLSTRSPSLQYQIKVLEDEAREGGSRRPSNKKTRAATSILEDIIPHTGVSYVIIFYTGIIIVS